MTPEALKAIQIPDDADLRTALLSLKQSGAGLVLVIDGAAKVVGLMTDGDIRTAMLERDDLHRPVVEVMNRRFVSVPEGTPKQRILKLLDSRIRALPILDGQGRLVDLARVGYLEPRNGRFARARAPVRISLAGGGTDFTRYFMVHGGVSLCTTINKHAHAILSRRPDSTIRIYSHDMGYAVEYPNLDAITYDGRLDLIKAGIKVSRPDFGLDLMVNCDFGVGTGLGGSAALLAAVLGCLNEYRDERLDAYAISELSFEAERLELGIQGGWQDQYSTVFGGVNFIEFDDHHNTVMPLRLQQSTALELQERFVLCNTGRSHRGDAIQKQNTNRDPDDPATHRFATEVKQIAYAMRANLLRGSLGDFGRLLNETWQLKKIFSPGVTDPTLEGIYDTALAAGAEGGRLLGTGGGGYFLFCTKPFERYRVIRALSDMGLATEFVTFDDTGLVSWTAGA